MKCVHCPREAQPGHKYCLACSVKITKLNRLRRQRRATEGWCAQCGKHPARPHAKTCQQCALKNHARKQVLRLQALVHYGGACACCGVDYPEFLQLDHIDGGGCEHHRMLQQQGTGLWNWLKKHNYPPGFRVLCANCNSALGFYGYCPHQGKPENWVPPDRSKVNGCSREAAL